MLVAYQKIERSEVSTNISTKESTIFVWKMIVFIIFPSSLWSARPSEALETLVQAWKENTIYMLYLQLLLCKFHCYCSIPLLNTVSAMHRTPVYLKTMQGFFSFHQSLKTSKLPFSEISKQPLDMALIHRQTAEQMYQQNTNL